MSVLKKIIPREDIENLLNQGLSLKEIHTKLGICLNTLYKHMDKHGIEYVFKHPISEDYAFKYINRLLKLDSLTKDEISTLEKAKRIMRKYNITKKGQVRIKNIRTIDA